MLKPRREKRKAAIADMLSELAKEKRKALATEIKTDPQKEREFFFKQGAIVAASVEGRANIPLTGDGIKGGKRFYLDGRSTDLCRISHCFKSHGNQRKRFLCDRHYDIVESLYKCEGQRANLNNGEPASNGAKANETQQNSSQLESAESWLCNYCEEEFGSYHEAASHEKDCGTVQVTTAIPGEYCVFPVVCTILT